MPFESTPLRDLKAQLIDNLRDRTGITNFSSTSKIGTLLQIVLDEHIQKVTGINEVLNNLRWTRASGKDLEEIGALVGIYRIKQKKAESLGSERNFEFYVDSGTFGDINATSNITIPLGTILYIEERFSSSGNRIEYEVVEDTILSSANNFGYVSVRCLKFGSIGNVRQDTIRKHLFTDYEDSANATLKIRNNYSVVNGVDEESDESMRSRISKAWTANSQTNRTSFEQLINTYPGVREIQTIPFYNGIGTTGVIVDFVDYNVSESYIASLQSRINQFAFIGETITVYKPLAIRLDLVLTVNINSGLSQVTKLGISRSIKEYVALYFRQTVIGYSVNLAALITNIISLHADIVGVLNTTAFDSVEADYYDHDGNFTTDTITAITIPADIDQRIYLNGFDLTLQEV